MVFDLMMMQRILCGERYTGTHTQHRMNERLSVKGTGKCRYAWMNEWMDCMMQVKILVDGLFHYTSSLLLLS